MALFIEAGQMTASDYVPNPDLPLASEGASTDAILRLSLFNGSGQAAISELTEQGISIIGSSAVRALIEQVALLEEAGNFRSCVIHTRPGWLDSANPIFVWPSGKIEAPDGSEPGLISFKPEPRLERQQGTVQGWLARVAAPLSDQPLLVFLLSAAFAPYIMRFLSDDWNFAIEMVGEAEVGKTLALKVLASSFGDPSSELVLTSASTTLPGLTNSVRWHSDRILFLNEMNSYGSGIPLKQRPEYVRDLGFLVSEGRPKAKDGTPVTWRSRTIAILTANDSIRSMTTGLSAAATKATLDRIMPFPIAQRHGIFSSIPRTYAGADEFFAYVAGAVEDQYGTVAPYFMKRLVERIAKDEGKELRGLIRTKVNEFAQNAKTITGRSGGRVARSFGLIAVGGRLAKRLGALPESFDCDAAAMLCLRLHLEAVAGQPTPRKKLLKILDKKDYQDLRSRRLTEISDTEMGRTAFLEHPRGGGLQLSMSAEALERFVGKPAIVLKDPELRALLDPEGKHLTKNRKVRLDRTDRLYCFNIAAEPKSALEKKHRRS